MSFMEKWDKAFESRDRDALSELLDDDFVFVRHQVRERNEKGRDAQHVDLRRAQTGSEKFKNHL